MCGDASSAWQRQRAVAAGHSTGDDENRATKVGSGVAVASEAAAMARSGRAAVAPDSRGDRGHGCPTAETATRTIFKVTQKPLAIKVWVRLHILT